MSNVVSHPVPLEGCGSVERWQRVPLRNTTPWSWTELYSTPTPTTRPPQCTPLAVWACLCTPAAIHFDMLRVLICIVIKANQTPFPNQA